MRFQEPGDIVHPCRILRFFNVNLDFGCPHSRQFSRHLDVIYLIGTSDASFSAQLNTLDCEVVSILLLIQCVLHVYTGTVMRVFTAGLRYQREC